MTAPAGDVRLVIVPVEGDVLDDAWQEDCRRLVSRINEEIEDLGARAVPEDRATDLAPGEGARGAELGQFSTIAIGLLGTGVASIVATRLFDLLTPWLARRQATGRCVIKGADGSEFTFENLSKDDLIALMERSASRTNKEGP